MGSSIFHKAVFVVSTYVAGTTSYWVVPPDRDSQRHNLQKSNHGDKQRDFGHRGVSIPPHHFRRRLSSAPRALYGQFPITEEFCRLSYPQSSTHPLYANRSRRSSPSCPDPSLLPYMSINRRPESASVRLSDSGSRISRPMLVYCNAHQSTASAGL